MSALSTVQDTRQLLQRSGLRVTRPRLAVLKVLASVPHATVDEVAFGVRQELTTVSTQALYDILGTLTAKGILRRMEPAGSAARYELTPEDNHQHLVCARCGEICDVVLHEYPLLSTFTDTHGYLVHNAEVTIWGTCPACQRHHPPKEQS